MRIVVADDTAVARALLRTWLEMNESPCEVIAEAHDGAEAVSLVEQLKPQWVIMDAEMPVMDGYAATRAIRNGFPEVSVVGFTSDEEAKEQLLAAWAEACFTKDQVSELISFIGC